MRWKPIEGETPIEDFSGLIPKHITTRAQLNVIEAENIRKAVVRYLAARPSPRLAPFDSAWFCRLHQEMLCDVWEWAGIPRRSEKNLGVPWHTIRGKLKKLADDVAFWETDSDMPRIEQSARLHHRAVSIHPFENGNGRWARLLTNVFLRRADAGLLEWPETTIGGQSPLRTQYLAALRRADDGDYEPVTGLHQELLREPG